MANKLTNKQRTEIRLGYIHNYEERVRKETVLYPSPTPKVPRTSAEEAELLAKAAALNAFADALKKQGNAG